MPTTAHRSLPPRATRPDAAPTVPRYDAPMTWADVCAHPALQDLPFKIELDGYGRLLLMSPASTRHSRRQGALQRLLTEHLGGEAIPECAVETSEGVRVPDVAWLSEAFIAAHEDEDVFTVAPEICIEVMSRSNPWGEMEEKVVLYLAKGAQEVWICEADGRLRWFGHEGERAASVLVPAAPASIA